MTTVISPSAASSSTLTTASMQPTSPGMFLKAYNIPTCYILRRKKWSSQWRQFMQLRKEAWKKIQDLKGVWTRDLAIPVQCSNNWATDVGSRSIVGSYVPVKEMSFNDIWNKSYIQFQLTYSQRQWLHSSVGRTSHQYREVTGSNPVEFLNIFFRLLYEIA